MIYYNLTKRNENEGMLGFKKLRGRQRTLFESRNSTVFFRK